MQQNAIDLLLLTPHEMGEIDKQASKVIPILALMENAGRAVAREIMKYYTPCKVLVLCGSGNNGGDGYVTARILSQYGWSVSIAQLHPPKAGSVAEQAASQWDGKIIPFDSHSVESAVLVVDAVFGAGLSRDLDEEVIVVLKKAKHVVAIDIPSGVDGASGEIKGYAPHAELTVTFCRAKPGHYLLPAREYIGKLVVADIGVPELLIQNSQVQCWLNEPDLWDIPVSGINDYKYHRGIVSVIGGEMTGAARLSSLAASSCGAGLVHIFALAKGDIYRLTSPCFMVDTENFTQFLQDKRRKLWVCGPGLSNKEVYATLPELIKAKKMILADAGALQRENLDLLKDVELITPHIGEFERVFGSIKGSRIVAVRKAARKLGAIVLLKGADTIIAAPDGRTAINVHADSRLATAGSGDVLTGIIGTFLASGMDSWEAACAGVWVHGEAAYLCKDSWPTALDIISNLGQARDNAKKCK